MGIGIVLLQTLLTNKIVQNGAIKAGDKVLSYIFNKDNKEKKDTGMIKWFEGKYSFLSNIYEAKPFIYNGLSFNSTEAAFQAQKTIDENERKAISRMSAKDAHRVGKLLKLRSDWETVKDGIMLDITRVKFQNPLLRNKLLKTKNIYLIYGNNCKDIYWGIDTKFGGQNRLGIILMQVREELRRI